jgi:O-antigen/teichoic acid export membrane protein
LQTKSFPRLIFPVNPVAGFQLFSVIRYCMLLLTAVYFAHSQMSVADIGLYETMLFFTAAVSFFYVSGLTTRMLSAQVNEKEKPLLTTVFILIFLVSAFISALILVFQTPLAGILVVDAFYIKIFAAFVFISNPGFLIEYIFLLQNKIRQLILYGILYGAIYLVAIILAVTQSANITTVLYVLLIVTSLRFLYAGYLILKVQKFAINITYCKTFFISSLPLIGSLLISGSASYIDSFLVSTFFGAEQLAIFRYGAKELPVSLLLANALSNAILPQMSIANNFDITLSKLKSQSTRLMHLVFPLSILLMLTSYWFYPIVFSQKFSGSVAIFNVYLLLVCSRVLFPQTVLLAKGFYKAIFFTSLIELLLNIFFSLLLMKYFGLIGIAMGTIIAFACEKIILGFILYSKFKIKPEEIIETKIYFLYIFFLITAFGITKV